MGKRWGKMYQPRAVELVRRAVEKVGGTEFEKVAFALEKIAREESKRLRERGRRRAWSVLLAEYGIDNCADVKYIMRMLEAKEAEKVV